MRFFRNFSSALGEIHHELVEMGTLTHAQTYQDKDVSQDENFMTMELTHYSYGVLDPKIEEIRLMLPAPRDSIVPTQPWAELEFGERVMGMDGNPVNPGKAYLTRQNVWETFLERDEDGVERFAYSYSERLAEVDQVQRIIERLRKDPDSRQGWVAIWNVDDVRYLGGISRVPCTIGYSLQIRDGKLQIHYIQRSADFITHFTNDVYMAACLQRWVANELGVPVGRFYHTIFSLHMFKKDGAGVF